MCMGNLHAEYLKNQAKQRKAAAKGPAKSKNKYADKIGQKKKKVKVIQNESVAAPIEQVVVEESKSVILPIEPFTNEGWSSKYSARFPFGVPNGVVLGMEIGAPYVFEGGVMGRINLYAELKLWGADLQYSGLYEIVGFQPNTQVRNYQGPTMHNL
jgi:hypothetical protein